ncbi:MAG: bifunctional riboflavin kinase/FAD synthetase [Pirellulales bacterium]
MRILRNLDDLPDSARSGAVAIGNFDGVHLGHARIVERLVAKAREVGGPSVVFTFDPHPVRLLRPDQCPPPLTWTARKAELLQKLRVDCLVVYPTDRQLLGLTPLLFFRSVVVDALAARAMVEGPNFFFGRDRAGTIDLLRQLATDADVALEVVTPRLVDGEVVSSSRIRRLIAAGEVDRACRMLTEPYRVRGMVTHGMARGAAIGFPTANLDAVDTLLPADGVYAGRGWLDGRRWPAAIHVGTSPTFRQMQRKVEVHLIGYAGHCYGEPLEVDFLVQLRDIRTFRSVDALRDQLGEDVARAGTIVAEQGKS